MPARTASGPPTGMPLNSCPPVLSGRSDPFWPTTGSLPDFPGDTQTPRGFTAADRGRALAACERLGPLPWLKTFFRLDYPLFRAALELMRELPPTSRCSTCAARTDSALRLGPGGARHTPPAAPPGAGPDRVVGCLPLCRLLLGEILESLPPDAWLIVARPRRRAFGRPARPHRHPPGEHSDNAKGSFSSMAPACGAASPWSRPLRTT